MIFRVRKKSWVFGRIFFVLVFFFNDVVEGYEGGEVKGVMSLRERS